MSRNNNEKKELRKSIERKSEQSQSLSDFDLFELYVKLSKIFYDDNNS